MKPFDYTAPSTIADAVSLLSQHNGEARVLAGGTDILVQLREGLREAGIVIDVKKIAELRALDCCSTSGLTLGASTPCAEIYGNADVCNAYPALTDAARIIGGWQIQSRASIGGNLCNASPAADSIPALIALNAVALVAGPSGQREIPVADFCTAPGRNALAAGELLVCLQFPAPSANASSAYQRFIPRNEMDIAVVGVGSWLQLDESGQTILSARVALGAVAPTPVFAAEASDWLAGKPATEDTYRQAGELARKAASPISDMRGTAEYRVHLVGVLTQRTLAKAVQRAAG